MPIDFTPIKSRWTALSEARLQEYEAAIPLEWAAAHADIDAALKLIADARDNIDGMHQGTWEDTGMTTKGAIQLRRSALHPRYSDGGIRECWLGPSCAGRPLILTRARKNLRADQEGFPPISTATLTSAPSKLSERGMKSVDRALKSEGLFKSEKTAVDYARIALPLDDSSLQWSPIGAGLTADPQKTFDQLYHRFVARHDRASERRRKRRGRLAPGRRPN